MGVQVPRWVVVPAVAAPVAMIGGWSLAAARQPSFDPVRETISALAATGAAVPWVMTAGLAVTGVAHVVTALALRPVPAAGRALHALGGLATTAVAALPVDRWAQAHGVAAGVAFAALAVWPAAAWRRGGRSVLAPEPALAAAAVLLALLAVFVVELQAGGAWTGLTERLVAGAQALWPLVVALALLAGGRGVTGPSAAPGPARR